MLLRLCKKCISEETFLKSGRLMDITLNLKPHLK